LGMKTLKFKHNFVEEVLRGKKTTTWRLFDDKDLTLVDELELIDRDSQQVFAKAVITEIKEKKIKDLTQDELTKHEYSSMEDIINSHRGYYGDKVYLDTDVKMITFKLI